MVRALVGLKARLTWNGIRSDTQRRFGFPIATILLGWAGWYLATSYVETAGRLDGAALTNFSGWAALLFFAAWVTLPVIIFPLDENLDPQQLAVMPMDHRSMVIGLAAASLVAPATVVPLLVLGANGAVLSEGWWMTIPASLVYLGLLAVGSQLFSAAISAILRTRRGRDIATFLILGLAAGSFFVYRSISTVVDARGLSDAVNSAPIADWALIIPPVAAQRAIVEAAGGSTVAAISPRRSRRPRCPGHAVAQAAGMDAQHPSGRQSPRGPVASQRIHLRSLGHGVHPHPQGAPLLHP